ncbi:MAG TPA: hypothetical protein VHC91_16240 [Trinickia sp.]|uniref:hypothetical protein n=1 Tax=Trinickia sp. TaxID=2571163 RepID=UPI002C645858|nr:hypothetical protein [Trinickia sp.]HVW51915.1 hypothetical protein [Trinickia sp.]
MTAVSKALRSAFSEIPPPSQATQLVQWQDVSTVDLAPYAPPNASVPMGQYAVYTVMQWAQAQGFAGAVPTWEVGDGTWGVICFVSHPGVSVVQIPIANLPGYDPNNPQACGQAIMRWATAQANGANQLAIPTYVSDGVNASALVFTQSYPPLSFYDAPNTQLYFSLGQPAKLVDLTDPAVWANAAMRVAQNIGYAAGWPTWEWTTTRGLIGIPEYDLGPLPEASSDNVDTVVAVLHQTYLALQNCESVASSLTTGVFVDFTAAPIADPTMQILVDCLFGAVQACLNAIPGVGGVLASLVSTGVQVAIDATKSSGGTFSLEQYQNMLVDATNATIDYVTQMHDNLQQASGDDLQNLWQSPYADPMSGRSVALGMLAYTPQTVVNGDEYWALLSQQLVKSYMDNLKIQISSQLYGIQSRTYPNRAPDKQWWDGTIASVTGPGGDCSQYVADRDEDLSVWYNGAQQVDDYVTLNEWWMQSLASGLPSYPPTSLVYNLFSDDGFGVTTGGWAGPFTKQQYYTQFFVPQTQIGLDGTYLQQWAYNQPGVIVGATVFGQDFAQIVAGYTDSYGRAYVSSSQGISEVDQMCGFTQSIITNYLQQIVNP